MLQEINEQASYLSLEELQQLKILIQERINLYLERARLVKLLQSGK